MKTRITIFSDRTPTECSARNLVRFLSRIRMPGDTRFSMFNSPITISTAPEEIIYIMIVSVVISVYPVTALYG
jgi:hypothetical protein